MSDIKPENYNDAPGLAQNLSQVEINTNTIPALSTNSGTYPRYGVIAYNVNSNGISNIVPDRYSVAPGLAQNLTYVEVDTSVIPALSGNSGVYPRYAQLVYLLNPSSGGGNGTGAVESVQGKTGNVVLSASDLDAYTKNETDNEITTNIEPLSVNISSLSASVWDKDDPDSIISKMQEKWYATEVLSGIDTLLNTNNEGTSTILEVKDNAITVLKILLIWRQVDQTIVNLSYKSINLILSKSDGILSSSDASIQTYNIINADRLINLDVQQIGEDLQISVKSDGDATCYICPNQRVINI